MPSTGEVKIHKIPVSHVGVLWPLVQPWLERGLKAAHDTSMAGILLGLKDGTDQLWAIVADGDVIGAFLTSIHTGDDEGGAQYLAVYALGGERLTEWAGKLGDEMARFAKFYDCASVRFCGRPGWERMLPSYRVAGEFHGETIFERTVS